mmetsp:Transcript_120129/g.285427  ORF Transcript_120129/g.285427 Transcript_120129/m.285427 type:complete len:204 (-) Transcript_120129:64-675(-)
MQKGEASQNSEVWRPLVFDPTRTDLTNCIHQRVVNNAILALTKHWRALIIKEAGTDDINFAVRLFIIEVILRVDPSHRDLTIRRCSHNAFLPLPCSGFGRYHVDIPTFLDLRKQHLEARKLRSHAWRLERIITGKVDRIHQGCSLQGATGYLQLCLPGKVINLSLCKPPPWLDLPQTSLFFERPKGLHGAGGVLLVPALPLLH